MIDRITKFSAVAIMATTALFFQGCSDEFLQDKKAYGTVTSEVYNDYEGAKGRVNILYQYLLPSSTSGIGFDTPSAGVADECSQSTEEYGGFSVFIDPTTELDYTTVPDYAYREMKNTSPYGRIRECNDIIEGVTASTLTEEQKRELLGQAYFFRAWCYYRLVKIYGGMPIIDHVQTPMLNDDGGLDLSIPRSTTKECIDFICDDLETASNYLPVNWNTTLSADYGRVTAGTALALQGRARLLYASPLFKRGDDEARWDLAYQSNEAAVNKLTEGGFGLAYAGNPGRNGGNWAKMFSDYQSPEAVFVTLYNTIKESAGTSYNKNNSWENSIRPKNTYGGGGKATTAQMVDLFPMADGMKPGESKYAYDSKCFFLNRDPRFYRTFAFPGVMWRFKGDPTSKGVDYPYTGDEYVLWNYTWYDDENKQIEEDQSGYGADGLATNVKGVYVRKRSDDLGVNSSPLYNYDLTVSEPFKWSGAPYMEMRYAEVLLNLAESACGIKNYDKAISILKDIRLRAGYSESDVAAYGDKLERMDRGELFGAILYERQIELAYEGKRFDDMRRWMLWDGGVGQEVLKSTWKLSGFNGNTCNYLKVTPFNETHRRTGIEVCVNTSFGTAEAKMDADPIVKAGITRPVLNLDDSKTVLTEKASEGATNTAIDNLADFYRANLYRKTTRVDGDPQYEINFLPKYYFIGFKQNFMQNNVTLLQNIGWNDYNQSGALGTFDPLAE